MENEILDSEIVDGTVLNTNSDIDEQKLISVNKFVFLSFISFGTYEVWWVYKAWRFFQQKDKIDIMPVARALFSIFFLHSLFTMILEYAQEKSYKSTYSATPLFVAYIILTALTRLPDPFWLVSMISFVVLIPPFKALNHAKRNDDTVLTTEQTKFSTRQIVLIVVGIIFWALVLIGTYVGEV